MSRDIVTELRAERVNLTRRLRAVDLALTAFGENVEGLGPSGRKKKVFHLRIPTVCKHCKRTFEAKKYNTSFCGRDCRDQARKAVREGGQQHLALDEQHQKARPTVLKPGDNLTPGRRA